MRRITESQLRTIIREELQNQTEQSFDIDELVSDITAGIYGDDRMDRHTLNAALLALDTLVAEIKRLKGI
jgi:hypothetical protein